MPVGEDLDALVRRVDEDRWLAARFAPPAARTRLIALYAAYFEIARAAEVASEGAIALMRLAWWRDAIAAAYEGGPVPQHPGAAALVRAIAEADLPRAPFDALLDARQSDCEPAPFATWTALDSYVMRTAGGLIALAVRACAPRTPLSGAARAALRAAGRAWGYIGLVRAGPLWAARNRTPLPHEAFADLGVDPADALAGQGPAHALALRRLVEAGAEDLANARRLSPALPSQAFPAVSYVTLAHGYRRDILRTHASEDPCPPGAAAAALAPVRRRLAILAATAAGRV